MFLSRGESQSADWPQRLHRDECDPPTVDHEAFTLTSLERWTAIMAEATSRQVLFGEREHAEPPDIRRAYLGFWAGPMGLIVIAETMAIVSHIGELPTDSIAEAHRRWWDYWREYWRLRETLDPLPYDAACEGTIPLAGRGSPWGE